MSEQFTTVLGRVPHDWEVKTIGELAIHIGSGVTPTGGSDVYTASGVTFIRSQNVTNDGLLLDDVAFIDNKTHDRMKGSEIFAFDVLLNITGASIGRCCYLPSGLGSTNVNQHVCAIRLPTANKADAKYLASVLASPIGQNQIFRLNAGGNREGLNYQQLRVFRIPWPPMEYRAGIARILTTVDNLIEKTEALIAKYQAVKQGLMNDFFTRGIDAKGRVRPNQTDAPDLYMQSDLGWIPKEWWVATIGDLFDKRTEHGREGLPVMSIVMRDGLVERSSVDRRVESNLPPHGHALVLKDDIAYNMMRMWQGVLGRATFDCLVSPAYVVLKPKNTINTRFAAFLFSDKRSIQKFRQFSQGVVDDRLRLYFHDLVHIPFAVPTSLDEQEEIARRIEACNNRISTEKTVLAQYQCLRLGLMQDLLTGKVRVKVDEGEFSHV
jgi:type I restriction enzyme S subunit